MLLSGLGRVFRPPRSAASKRAFASFAEYLSGDLLVMFDDNDKWPLPDYITGPTKHLHALGVVSLNFNIFESLWASLLSHYIGWQTASFLLSGRVTDEWRVAVTRHYANLKEKELPILSRIELVANAYSICAENRNILMHSKQFFSGLKANEDRLSMLKKSNDGNILKFHFRLEQLRGVADDMMLGCKCMWSILEYLDWRDAPDVGAPNYSAWPDTPLSRHKLDPAEILEG